jgi:4-hydroxy-3-methylbut-2-enyl diphosphate reductase
MGIKINIARSAGFCFGVHRAINTALRVAGDKDGVYMLGDIVHNDTVVADISSAGIRKISRLGRGKGKTLLIRAHGASRLTYQKARAREYEIVDATCPMVKEIHKIALNAENGGSRIAVIGDKNHDEVKGIVGQLRKRPFIISDLSDLKRLRLPKNSDLAIIVQSTQNIESVKKIVDALAKRAKRLRFFNTICRPTTQKQQEARDIAGRNDVVIVLGSHKSANTQRLYEISKAINPRTHRIGTPARMKRSWLKNAKSVGILAGASTPDEIIKETASVINLPR